MTTHCDPNLDDPKDPAPDSSDPEGDKCFTRLCKSGLFNPSNPRFATFQYVPSDKIRDIIAILLGKIRGGSGGESKGRNNNMFKLGVALGNLQFYYTKSRKCTSEFEDDLNDALTEFNTTCRSQTAPYRAKVELF